MLLRVAKKQEEWERSVGFRRVIEVILWRLRTVGGVVGMGLA